MTLPHYELAQSEIGISAIPGPDDNPKVVQMYADVGHSTVDNDEVHWCAAAVGSWLERSGVPSTGKLHARSYLDWGYQTGDTHDLSRAKPGDVIILWRVSRNSWQGHVGLYVKHDANHVWILGGNQGRRVSIRPFPRGKVLETRRHPSFGKGATAEPAHKGGKFTEAFLRQIAPRGSNTLLTVLPDLLNELLPKYGITTPKRIALFMANVLVETGGLSALEENLSYSAERMTQVWPKRFPTLDSAKPYAHNPRKFANLVYNRWGNKGIQGAGWKYRGRGLMQTTFINNYQVVQDVTGLPVVKNPDLLLDPRNALIAACIYWKQAGCNELADANKITECRRTINGGTHGLAYVKSYYRKVLPLVQNFDLANVKTKVTTGLTTVGAGGGISTGGWIAIGIAAVVIIALAGFIGYRIWRNKRDVEEGLESLKGLEDEVAESDLDLRVGAGDHLAERHKYLDGDGSESTSSA